MKGIIKLFPAALAVFALASCSNEDFFGSNEVKQTQKLIATIEPTNTDLTRAAWVSTKNDAGKDVIDAIWQDGDLFRVYDEALQKYDEYECNGTDISLQGSAVTTHAKAIFPGDFVYYAGYDKANDDVVAVMEVPSTLSYNGLDGTTAMVENAGKVGYVSWLPQWGDTKNETEDKLEVDLKWLTGIADVTVYKGGAKKIRIVAATDAQTTTTMKADNVSALVDTDTPLAGYFEAQLKTDGVLKKTDNALVVAANSASSVIEVDLTGNDADSIHVYIPIIPATYEKLFIQYTDGTTDNWKTFNDKPYTEQTINRGTLVKKGLSCGEKPIQAKASSFTELQAVLNTIAANYAGKPVNIELTGEVATTDDADAAKQTLTIPAFGDDQILSIKGTIKNEAGNRPLIIKNTATAGTVTLNLTVAGTENVEIKNNAAGNLQLTGSIASTGTDVVNHGTIKVNGTGAGALTLGNGEFSSFTTAMPIEVSANQDLTVDAGEGSVNSVKASGSGAVTIKSGTVTTATVSGDGALDVDGGVITTATVTGGGNITVDDAAITTLTHNKANAATIDVTNSVIGTLTDSNKAVSGTINITGSEITTLDVKASTGNLTIENSSIESVDTKSGTIKLEATADDATVSTLKLEAAAGITVTGGAAPKYYVAKVATLNANEKAATVSSTGKAVITTVSKLGDGSTFTSKWSDKGIATDDINSNGEIYTAAQLGGVTTGKNYKLMADITIDAGKDWTPVNLNGQFNGNEKTISCLNAPLFGTISGGKVFSTAYNKPFKLDDVVVDSKAADQGALAKVVNGTVEINYVEVQATTATTIGAASGDANSKNIGGLIGRIAGGTVQLLDNKVTATVQGYANVGGYIGNVAGGTVKILTSQASAILSTITFAKTLASTAPDANAGTFGNFIGSITGTGVSIEVGTNDATDKAKGLTSTKGNAIAKFFDITTTGKGVQTGTITGLEYAMNKNANNDTFKGMQGTAGSQTLNYEIGYSTGTISKLTLYNVTKTDLNMDYTLTIDHINQY